MDSIFTSLLIPVMLHIISEEPIKNKNMITALANQSYYDLCIKLYTQNSN